MNDSMDTDRFNAGLAAASAGYADAATAAYAEMMTFGLDMWCAALSGFVEPNSADAARASERLTRKPEPAFGLSRDDWCGLPWLDPQRVEIWSRLMFPADPADAYTAFASLTPLRGRSAAWPVAKSMIDAGVPRSIAWPAAEANAAALDATDAAVAPLRKAFGKLPSPVGFAASAMPHPSLAFVMCCMPLFFGFRPTFG